MQTEHLLEASEVQSLQKTELLTGVLSFGWCEANICTGGAQEMFRMHFDVFLHVTWCSVRAVSRFASQHPLQRVMGRPGWTVSSGPLWADAEPVSFHLKMWLNWYFWHFSSSGICCGRTFCNSVCRLLSCWVLFSVWLHGEFSDSWVTWSSRWRPTRPLAVRDFSGFSVVVFL